MAQEEESESVKYFQEDSVSYSDSSTVFSGSESAFFGSSGTAPAWTTINRHRNENIAIHREIQLILVHLIRQRVTDGIYLVDSMNERLMFASFFLSDGHSSVPDEPRWSSRSGSAE